MSGGELAFTEILKLAAYLVSLWYAGRLCGIIGLSSIPAEIGIGLIFGPSGLDLIHTFSEEFVPLQFLGFVGVSLIIFESGMHLDLRKVLNLDVGGNAVIVAMLGTLLPIVLGIAMFIALGFSPYPDALAAGFSLAPTSVGISLSLLTKVKQLHSHYGQIIISAAFLDDIFSIICLVVLVNLATGSFDPVQHTVLPLIYAFLFVGFGAAASIYITPPICEEILKPRRWMRAVADEGRTLGVKDEVHLTILFFTYIIFSWIGDFIGSSLLGAFVAGMMFANVPRSHLIWVRQFKRAVAFLLKLFFGATVAFSIQLSTLFTGEAFWKGLVMAIIPCLGAKLLCALHIGSERWIVGVAMMARGEFAYLVAEQAHSEGQLSDLGYAVIVWALLWATILAPMVFSSVLQSFVLSQFKHGLGNTRAPRIGGGSFSGESSFIIRLTGAHHVGMVREICDTLSSQGLDVVQSSTETDGIVSTGTFIVQPREAIQYQRRAKEHILRSGTSSNNLAEVLGKTDMRKYKIATDLDDEKLDQIAHALKETIADSNAVVLFEATEKEEEVLRLTVIEIKLFGERNQEALRDITAFLLEECELDVRKAIVDHSTSGVDYSVFYCSRRLEGEEEDEVEVEQDSGRGSTATGGRGSATAATATGGISAPREKSGSSIAGMIAAVREKSGTSIADLITARRENTNASAIVAKRENTSASIALRAPPVLEKTIEIQRKDTTRSAILDAKRRGEDVTAEQLAAALKEAQTNKQQATHVVKEIYSTFTAEQRDFIREGIRNIYSAHGLIGGQALVKMIHEDEMESSVGAAEFYRGGADGSDAAGGAGGAGDTTDGREGVPKPHKARSTAADLTALVNKSSFDLESGKDDASAATTSANANATAKGSPKIAASSSKGKGGNISLKDIELLNRRNANLRPPKKAPPAPPSPSEAPAAEEKA